MKVTLDGDHIRIFFRYKHSAKGKQGKTLQSVAEKVPRVADINDPSWLDSIAQTLPPNVTECWIVPGGVTVPYDSRPGDIPGLLGYGRVFKNHKDTFNREIARRESFLSAIQTGFSNPGTRREFVSWFRRRKKLERDEASMRENAKKTGGTPPDPFIYPIARNAAWTGHKRSGKGKKV